MDLKDEEAILALKISEELKEREVDLVHAVIAVMGCDYAMTVLKNVRELLEKGGVDKKDGGKRTPGGIYFNLVRNSVSLSEVKLIFGKQATEKNRRHKARKRLIKKLKKLDII